MEYTLKLEQDDVQLIVTALGELPLKATLKTWFKLNEQVRQQDTENAVELKNG